MNHPDRPLYLCDVCGRYTDSIPAHFAYKRCVQGPYPHSANRKTMPVKGSLAKPVVQPAAGVEGVKAARRVGVIMQKVPVGPLIEAAGPSIAEASRRLSVPARSLHRWLKTGIPWDTADMLAVRFGLHPGEIWDDWAAYGLEEAV